MVGMVFERVKTRLHMKEARANLDKLRVSRSSLAVDRSDDQDLQSEQADGDETTETASDAAPAPEVVDESGVKLTLKDLEHRKDPETPCFFDPSYPKRQTFERWLISWLSVAERGVAWLPASFASFLPHFASGPQVQLPLL